MSDSDVAGLLRAMLCVIAIIAAVIMRYNDNRHEQSMEQLRLAVQMYQSQLEGK